MGEVELFFGVTSTAAIAGFLMGWLYGLDLGKERFGRNLRAAEAEARECRQMALNLAQISKEQGAELGALRARFGKYT